MTTDWPQPGDSLFNSSPDWEAEALLGNSPDWFLSYVCTYKTAVGIVVERVIAKEASPDAIAYAVCFLCRHYLGKPGTDGTFPVSCDCGTFCSWLDSHASSLSTPRTM
jgi:hypothetical protein